MVVEGRIGYNSANKRVYTDLQSEALEGLKIRIDKYDMMWIR